MPAAAANTRSRRSTGQESLTDVAYRAIKEEILSNHLHPGQPVPTERFITQLGLSRTPLREAILRLEKEGFIEIKPRMGTFVSHLDLRQIQDMYQVRRTLEGLAARQSAGTISPEKLAAVERELLRHPVEGKIDCAAVSEAGQGVHRIIVESCGNAVLMRFIQSLQDHFRRFRSLSLDIPEKILSSHREHIAILEALKRNDGERAERLIHEHFDHAARYLLDSLLTSPAQRREAKVTVPFPG